MESRQGKRSIFYTRLCKKVTKEAHQALITLFYSQLQQPPCTVTQRGAPTLSASAEPHFKMDYAN